MNEPIPPCRVCGSSEKVLCYPDDHAQTICPDCCTKGAEHENGETGHEWEHDPHERDRFCVHCGIFRSHTDYDYSEEYEP